MTKIIFFFLLSSLFLYGQDTLTVEEAIKIGLKNNFDIRIARNSAEISNNNRGLGTAGFLPTLDASGSMGITKTSEDTNSPFSFGSTTTENYSGSLMMNWTLFDGFKMFVSKSKFNQMAELGYEQARNQIETSIVQIMQAYFNVVQQSQLLDVAKDNLTTSASRLEKETLRSKIGGMSSTDLLNAKVVYNNDLSAHLNQELQLEIAVKNLNIALGQDPHERIIVQKKIGLDYLDMEYNDILSLAMERNSIIAAYLKSKEIADKDVKLSQSVFYPRLSLNGGTTYNNRDITRDIGGEISSKSTNYQGTVQLSWNLFNGMRNSIDLQNAKIKEKNAKLNYNRIKNIISGLVREKYATYQKRIQLMHIADENVEAARQNLERQQERYNLGTTTSLDFRDAQLKLVKAQASYITSRYQARISRLEVDQLTGNLDVKINKD
jgi:outer membrane protein TolC